MQIIELSEATTGRDRRRSRPARRRSGPRPAHLRLVQSARPEQRDVAGRPLAELSTRELEVLGLMAEGLSDRGIAARLWLTQKTVESHIRNIFRKLRLPVGSEHNRRVAAVVTYLTAGGPASRTVPA